MFVVSFYFSQLLDHIMSFLSFRVSNSDLNLFAGNKSGAEMLSELRSDADTELFAPGMVITKKANPSLYEPCWNATQVVI